MKAKKAAFTGIGLIHQTAEKAEDLAEELIERGQLKRKDSRGFIKTILDRAQGERAEFQTVLREIVQDIFESLGVATRAEVDAMIAKLDRLEAKLKVKSAADKKRPRKKSKVKAKKVKPGKA